MGEGYFKFWFISKFILFCGIGLMMFNQGCSNYIEIKKAEKWTRTTAYVTKNEVDIETNSTEKTYYTPIINYEYNFNNKEYTNDVIKIGTKEGLTMEWQAEEKIKDYPLHTDIEILVNPNLPKQSTIKLGEASSEKPLMYMGGFFFLIGYLINRKTINHIFKKLFYQKYKRKHEYWFIAK